MTSPPRTAAAPAPRRVADDEPHLRLVRAQRRARTRLLGGAAVTVVFVMLFGVAALQAVLVQGQLRLDQLDRDMTGDVEAREQLQLQVATLEAPSRIEETARQLGMVPPPEVVFLEAPSGPVASPSTSVAVAPPPDPALVAARP